MSRLGIIIVHYRAEALCCKCVSRLKASNFTNWTAVIVDNEGTPGVAELEERSRITVERPGRNLGFSRAVNLGLTLLPDSVSLVLLLNADVLVEPDTLGAMVDALEQEPGVGALTCRLLLPSGRIDPACRRSDPTAVTALAKQLGLSRLFPRSPLLGRYNLTFLDDSRPHEVDAVSGAFMLIRREVLDEAGGGMDERFYLYGEDLDLCRRIRGTGHRIFYRPEATALHVKGSGRIRAAQTTVHFYRAMWTYYRKWGRFRSNPIVLAGLAGGLVTLGTAELVRNGLRRIQQTGRTP